jgi:cell division protein FtsX
MKGLFIFMKEIFENFKRYTNKINEGADESQMKISLLMVIDRNVDRYKEDILSDIRAVTGVTIINIEQHKNVKNLDYNVVSMKFDLDPYKSPDPDVKVDMLNALLRIRKQLLTINGIIRIKYLSKPERY